MNHEWRAIIQYRLNETEARQLVQGYGHPEVDNAPDRLLATGERPAVGDPRVFLGTHNMLRKDTVVVCWNCEEAWTPELAGKSCSGESPLVDAPPLGNIRVGLGTVGRNDPCPCGSGLKFKRCHGAN
jgi:uncharacterized Zn-finger protein